MTVKVFLVLRLDNLKTKVRQVLFLDEKEYGKITLGSHSGPCNMTHGIYTPSVPSSLLLPRLFANQVTLLLFCLKSSMAPYCLQ